jgi:hypothetical protein
MATSHPLSFLRVEDFKSRQGRFVVAVLSFPSSPVGRRASNMVAKEEDHRVSGGFEIERITGALQIVSIVPTSAL